MEPTLWEASPSPGHPVHHEEKNAVPRACFDISRCSPKAAAVSRGHISIPLPTSLGPSLS